MLVSSFVSTIPQTILGKAGIDFSKNYLTGSIGFGLSRLNLLRIILSYNYFTGILPDDILSNVQDFVRIEYNMLSGTIPKSFRDQSKLKIVSMYNNMLSGTLPEWLCDITTLEQVIFSCNQLQGSIPSCIENLSNLQGCKFKYQASHYDQLHLIFLLVSQILSLGGFQLDGWHYS